MGRILSGGTVGGYLQEVYSLEGYLQEVLWKNTYIQGCSGRILTGGTLEEYLQGVLWKDTYTYRGYKENASRRYSQKLQGYSGRILAGSTLAPRILTGGTLEFRPCREARR